MRQFLLMQTFGEDLEEKNVNFSLKTFLKHVSRSYQMQLYQSDGKLENHINCCVNALGIQ